MQIENKEKLFIKIERNSDCILSKILNMDIIHIQYLNQDNHTNKQFNQT